MTTTLKANFDQQAYEDANRVLLAEAGMYENRLRTAGQTVPSRPAAASSQNVIAINDALSAHVAQLKTLAGVSANSAPQTGNKAKAPKVLDRVLAAKGCKTLAELEQKHREQLSVNPNFLD
jgi:hypothetical protein